jgi:hypothetical protein
MPETTEIFGRDQVFELRGLLCEKTGCDLRNRLAHGFLTYTQCWDSDVMNVWWLVIRVISFPIAERCGALALEPDSSRDEETEKTKTEPT